MKHVLLVTGPSGIGKTHLGELLLREYPGQFINAKLHTTRQPRPGEHGSDRIFVTPQEFSNKQAQNEFLVAGMFHNNWYGYSKTALTPEDRHIIVNAWPALVPQFLHIPHVTLLGLSIESDDLTLLIKRLQDRGDSPEVIRQRIQLIKNDLNEMKKIQPHFNQRGKNFVVSNDTTLATVVLPWIEQELLQT